MERLVEAASQAGPGDVVVFEAPTGYGKTSASPGLYTAARRAGGPPRLIHVLPLRAVVEDAYRRFSGSLGGGYSIGYQAHGLGLAGKAPFMYPDLVVTTLDSFTLNLYRWNVAEDGFGHYEVPRASIFSSLTVMDEAHIPLAGGPEPAAALLETVRVLALAGTPVVVETATLSPGALRELEMQALGAKARVRMIAVTPPGTECPSRFECVRDEDYYGWAAGVEWSVGEANGDPARAALEEAHSGRRVFAAYTTVKDAVKAYRALAGELGGDKVALVHGRLTARDRERAVEAVRDAMVIVGTSAVEAGVDFDVDVLVSDVPACALPGGRGKAIAYESLLQRMGRVCRSPGRRCEARVYLHGPRSGEAAAALAGVNPRVPMDWRGARGYRGLLGCSPPDLLRRVRRMDDLEALALKPLTPTETLYTITRNLCTPMRSSPLIPVVVPPEGWSPRCRGAAEALADALEAGDYVLVDSKDAADRAGSWLEPAGPSAVYALYHAQAGLRGHPDASGYRLSILSVNTLKRCSSVAWEASRGLAALVARPGAYEPGVGLL